MSPAKRITKLPSAVTRIARVVTVKAWAVVVATSSLLSTQRSKDSRPAGMLSNWLGVVI